MPSSMMAGESDSFRPGAQLAAELLTGVVSVEGFDALGYARTVLNVEESRLDALMVAMMALHESVAAHARYLAEYPPAGGVAAYLGRQGETLAGTLRFLDTRTGAVDGRDDRTTPVDGRSYGEDE